MQHTASTIEHIVLKTEPWQLVDLLPGRQISSLRIFDIYTDRQEAIDAIHAVYPDYEPPEWEPPTLPDSVTMRQARIALLQSGVLDQVDAAIAAIPDPAERRAAEIEWEYGAVVDRLSPWVVSLTAALGMTPQEVDGLFRLAVTL